MRTRGGASALREALLNLAPDEPFGGFPPDDPDDVAADPDTTGQVM